MALKNASTLPTSPAKSGVLSPLQIAAVAATSGGIKDVNKLRMAVAIALAESGGDPTNVSPTEDYGLWQINRPTWDKAMNPNGIADWSRIKDPAYNAQIMAKVSHGGTNWSDWSTYKNGAYRSYLNVLTAQQLQTAAKIPGTTGGGFDPGSVINAITSPIKWADEAYKAIVAFLKIMVDPEKLGRHIANALIWLLRQFVKALYNVIILPPWRWTQRATIYYYDENIVGGGRSVISVKALATMSFWAVGYGILWGKFSPPEIGVDAGDSALATTATSVRNAVVSRRITKPKDVAKNTPKKPEPTSSTVQVKVVKHVAASRRRAVKVTDPRGTNGTNGRPNNDNPATQAAQQQREEANPTAEATDIG